MLCSRKHIALKIINGGYKKINTTGESDYLFRMCFCSTTVGLSFQDNGIELMHEFTSAIGIQMIHYCTQGQHRAKGGAQPQNRR